jgi:hypothetical protein
MFTLRLFRPSVRLAVMILAGASPAVAGAQERVPADSAYIRAHRLVAQGRGDAGRAIVDSMLRVVATGTPEYAEGLFWRASTATRAEDAERDYLRIVIEYPLSPRAEDALIRLAEMEMLRGDRTRAQRHLQRLIVEHPNGASRAKASYWLARLFFEANELTRACNELSTARSKLPATDVELKNQVEYQAQRCVGVEMGGGGGSGVGGRGADSGAGSRGVSGGSATGVSSNTGASNPATASNARTSSPPPASAAPPQTPPPASRLPLPATRTFTVQVAAFPTRDAAATFMESLRAKGYEVRVWGTEAPFRVRIGTFATRAEAGVLAQEVRTKMISKDAWVTETEVR